VEEEDEDEDDDYGATLARGDLQSWASSLSVRQAFRAMITVTVQSRCHWL